MENKQPRWKSKVLWMSLLPIVLLLGDSYNVWNIIGMNKDVFTQVFVTVLSFLVGIGILNNPSDAEKY